MNEPSSELFAKLAAQVAETPSPTRPQAQRHRRWILGLVFGGVGVMAVRALSIDLTRGGGRGWVAAVWLGLAFSLYRAARRPAAARPIGWLDRTSGLWVPAAMIMGVVALQWSGAGEGWTGGHHRGCFLGSLMVAALPTLALLYLARHTDPVAPGIRGWLLGALGGVAGVIPFYLECVAPSSVEHASLGHVAPVLVMAVLGALIGRRWLALR